jgi:hypothetical protein
VSITREQIVHELWSDAVNRALIAAQQRARRPEPPTGTDGAETCDGTCPTGTALREQVREYKAADQLVRFGPFSPTGAQIHKYLIEQTHIIRRNGQAKGALLRPDVAAATNTNEKAVTRAWAEIEALQQDPALKAVMPFWLDRRPSPDGKEHVDLIVPDVAEPPTRTEMYIAARQLPRLKAAHGGRRETKLPPDNPPCRKCGEPMATHRTRQDVCLNDACGNVVTYPTRVVQPPRDGPIVMHGRTFEVAARPAAEDPGQDVPDKTVPYRGQDVPGPTGPTVSFATRDDLELFDTPNYQGEAPPEPPPPPKPLPIAPRSHIAPAFRRLPSPVQAVAGGEE